MLKHTVTTCKTTFTIKQDVLLSHSWQLHISHIYHQERPCLVVDLYHAVCVSIHCHPGALTETPREALLKTLLILKQHSLLHKRENPIQIPSLTFSDLPGQLTKQVLARGQGKNIYI